MRPRPRASPTVATFHTYSTSALVGRFTANVAGARRLYSKLSARIAVSEAARWTAQRWYGGRYRIVPNGVDLSAARPSSARPHDELQILFVGRAEARKGLPVLLRAFEALRNAGVSARLTVAGATETEVEPLLLERDGVEIAGRVSDEEKWRLLGEADLLCAPSLGGESFGMVLTEAFASGTPVVASAIAGYSDVVTHGHDGLLVPVGDAGRARRVAAQPRARPGAAHAHVREPRARAPSASPGRRSPPRSPRSTSRPSRRPSPRRARSGSPAASGSARPSPGRACRRERLPSLEPTSPSRGRKRAARAARRVVVGGGVVAGVGLTALALQRIGIESIGRALLAATPVWVLVAFALMCASMLLRAEAWHAILRAALPGVRVRRRDTARAHDDRRADVGDPAGPARRALASADHVAPRSGECASASRSCSARWSRRRVLNILALAVLGSVMFATVGLFQGNEDALVVATIAPIVLLALVLAAPWILRRGKPHALPARPAGRRRGAPRDGPGAQRPAGVPQARSSAAGRR